MAAEQVASGAQNLSKAANIANIAAMGLEVVADTIIKIDDTAKRRKAMLALQTLSQRERMDLEKKMARASTVTQRIAMLGDLMLRQRIAIKQLEQKKMIQRALIAGGVLVGAVMVVLTIDYVRRSK